MRINFGTTNFDGSGSSANLNDDNSFSIDPNIPVYQGHGVVSQNSGATFSIHSNEWNGAYSKEVSVETDATVVHVSNFVDVDLTVNNDVATVINISDAKRGQIDTSEGDSVDVVNVFVEAGTSTNPAWSHLFQIDTGNGDDIITMQSSGPGSYDRLTEYTIDAGAGRDQIHVDGLTAPIADVTRHVDGNEGFDTLTTNGDSDQVTFEGIEAVIGTDGATLTVDSAVLENNGEDAGLILSNIDVTIDDDVFVEQTTMTQEQSDYLTQNDFNASEFAVYSYEDADNNSGVLFVDQGHLI